MSTNSYYKGKLASQPPLKKINSEYYNPFVHTPPTGLEKNITLRSLGPRQPVSVTQKQSQEYKPGEDAEKDTDYGHFVEMGGKRRKKSKRKSIRKKKSTKKKSRKYKTKTKRTK
jgi:hypothetical protein